MKRSNRSRERDTYTTNIFLLEKRLYLLYDTSCQLLLDVVGDFSHLNLAARCLSVPRYYQHMGLYDLPDFPSVVRSFITYNIYFPDFWPQAALVLFSRMVQLWLAVTDHQRCWITVPFTQSHRPTPTPGSVPSLTILLVLLPLLLRFLLLLSYYWFCSYSFSYSFILPLILTN